MRAFSRALLLSSLFVAILLTASGALGGLSRQSSG